MIVVPVKEGEYIRCMIFDVAIYVVDKLFS